jgi:hypothetical protein
MAIPTGDSAAELATWRTHDTRRLQYVQHMRLLRNGPSYMIEPSEAAKIHLL